MPTRPEGDPYPLRCLSRFFIIFFQLKMVYRFFLDIFCCWSLCYNLKKKSRFKNLKKFTNQDIR